MQNRPGFDGELSRPRKPQLAQMVLMFCLVAALSFVSGRFSSRLDAPASRVRAAVHFSWSGAGQEHSASATTGQQFKGEPVRRYMGKLLFSDLQPQQQQQQQQQRPWGPQGGRRSDKWAVCTTVFRPSQQILDTLKLPGWNVVVVGDRGAVPFNVTMPNLVYLNVADQQQLALQYPDLLELLPWKHFGRKNLGYLYAIANGAKQIWDFDDDNGLQGIVEPALPIHEVYQVLAEPSCEAFNPYPLMGAPKEGLVDAWPRGFPLQLIRHPCSHMLVPGNASRVVVVQSLADHEPDVDGIFRLTRSIPFNFDQSSKRSLVLPQGTLAPYNAQATLVLHPGLFTQLLPVTVHGRVSDIWRGYIAQRLLWDVGYQLAFSPPMVTQRRNPHNHLADMQSEEPLYYQAGALVQHLRQWQGTAPTIAGRHEQLVIDLYERQYIELEDVQLTQQWLLALQGMGYTFPPLVDWPAPSLQVTNPVVKRTAVCVSGQMRTIEKTIADITINLFSGLVDYDVFVYVQSRGTPLEPKPGDMTACDIFKQWQFPNAKVFCQVVQEQPVNLSSYIALDLLKSYIYANSEKHKVGLLQQLLGLQGSFNMAKKHSFATGTKYDYVVRLRPDNVLFDPLPSLSVFNDSRTLYIPSITFMCCGNEDIFHISSWNVAEAIMNRVDTLKTEPMLTGLRAEAHARKRGWVAEDIVRLTCKHHNFSLVDYPDLHVHVQRRPGQQGGTSEP